MQVDKKILVYSRKPKSKYKSQFILDTLQESDPVMDPNTRETSFNSSNFIPTDDLSIALRNHPRSYTTHPISKYVSYNTLSPKFHAITTNLDKIIIPKDIDEIWEIP